MNTIKIDIKKLHEDAVIPTYGTEGAAGFDFYSVDDYVVDPGKTVIVKTGLAVAVPIGYYLAVVPRSGVSAKTGIRIANSPGTVDADYRGEVGVIVTNTSNDTFTIEEIGSTVRLSADVIPYGATDPSIIWTTSDASVASVDSTGLVTAVKEGTATITVTTTV